MRRSRTLRSFSAATLLVAATLGAPRGAHAEEPLIVDAGPEWALTVTGQVRPRFVMHSGLDFRGTASEWRELVTQRARLGLSAEAASGVAVTLQVQDVRVWGEEATPDDFSAAGFDLHQAFATVPFGQELLLRVGRLELAQDDERLVGRSDFTQRGRSFDGGSFSWESVGGRFAMDALYAKVTEAGTSPDGSGAADTAGDVDFFGVHASLELAPGHVFAPLYLVHIRDVPGLVRHNAGFHVKGESAGFHYRSEAYYQYGKLGAENISAYLAALRVGYRIEHPLRPGISAWGEVLSGNGKPEGAFDTLYGSNHPYYGEMDVFTTLPADTTNLGLVDLGGRLEGGITEDLSAELDGHWFRTVKQPPGASSNLGVEFDAKLRWKAMDYVTLDALGGLFAPGGGMHGLRGAPATGPLRLDYLTFLTANMGF